MAKEYNGAAPDSIGTLVCEVCGLEVSGPSFASVAEAMERHRAKTGHKA